MTDPVAPRGPMPDNPSQGDSTDDSLSYTYGKQHFAPAEGDPSKIALEIQRLHYIAGALNPSSTQQAPQVAGTSLAATGTVDASGTETTVDGWAEDANGDGSYVPTVTLGGSTYLDVRHLAYLRIRADLDTDGAAWVYERLSASDDDNNKSGSGGDSVLAADGATTVYASSVEGVNYARVSADQTATVYAGGSA